MSVHVFVGPTLAADQVAALVGDAIVHPPVQHGDLLRMTFGPADVVVIVDGYYHQAGAVRHKEILSLLAAGVRVVGCSSMGALRAAELAPFGMVGSGVVFAMYRDDVIDADDEVALAHSEAPEYRPFSLPLVNVRHTVRAAECAGVLSSAEAAAVLECARAEPYAARTWQDLERRCGEPVARLRDFLSRHPEHADIKAADAIDALRRLDRLAVVDPRAQQWTASKEWRTKFLHEWQANFEGAVVEDIHVSHGSVVRFRQIYDQGFSRRWRSHVLTLIADSAPAEAAAASLEHRAVPRGAHHHRSLLEQCLAQDPVAALRERVAPRPVRPVHGADPGPRALPRVLLPGPVRALAGSR